MDYRMHFVLEIARGDSIESLLENGIIAPQRLYAAQGGGFDGYVIVGGTKISGAVYRKENRVICDNGMVFKRSAYGFGNPPRERGLIHRQGKSGAHRVAEVFMTPIEEE